MIEIDKILQEIDECYEEHRSKDAEQLMHRGIAQAMEEQDEESLLQLLNELLGHYRETGQVENSYAIAERAIAQAKKMGLEGTIPYATTLLNVANAYRAGGRLEDSLSYYAKVRSLYDRVLAPDNMLVASLENNISLLYQEMGDFGRAKDSLLKALQIVLEKEADFEVAVTYANLSNTCIQLGEPEQAYEYGEKAIEGFDKLGVADTHYGAALSALGAYYYEKQQYEKAASKFRGAMEIMERNLGRNEFFYRLQENVAACERGSRSISGLELSERYYEAYGKAMIEEKFGDFADKIAVGLVGEGSECFGYDDALSRDHDWGPEFCLWVTDETYEQIGEKLQAEYEKLPREFLGFRRNQSERGRNRRGVMTIDSFYQRLLHAKWWEEVDWQQVSDASLAAAVNGKVFRDDEGIFAAMRKKLQQGYPKRIQWLKIVESMARFSQTGQYNYARMLRRKDKVSAQIMLGDCLTEAMKLQHYIEGNYPPHDKWLYRSIQETEKGRCLAKLIAQIAEGSPESVEDAVEQTAAFLVGQLYEKHFISDSDTYLDAHTEEVLYKSMLVGKSNEELVEQIVRLEFEAFDKVRNVGGRASCQNDWATFSIMRKSQYLTWNHTMLLQYLYDFEREYQRGHNLITEKYGRMMESTAPKEYEKLKDHFPILSEEKKAIIEQIVQMQVAWMDEFATNYPYLADNARSVRTAEDNLYNTSYETYLRGEISTYSDKMLELYGRYVVEYARHNQNLTFEIMENSVHLYGYKDLDSAEKFLRQ